MKVFLSAFLSMMLLVAAGESQTMSHEKLSSGNGKFLSLCDQFVKQSLALSPVGASQAGYHHHVDPKTKNTIELDAELDDMSNQAFEEQSRFYREWRQRFQRETPIASLNAEDAADYRMIDDQISLGLLE